MRQTLKIGIMSIAEIEICTRYLFAVCDENLQTRLRVIIQRGWRP